jgi:chemotaxis protein histidine kinase CheA
MGLLDDPEMKEIVDGFCDESIMLLDQLESCLEDLEGDPTQVEKLEEFGQVIDRIMGAARTVGADEIATFCELGKAIGYKSSQTKDEALLEVVVAVLFDAQHLIKLMVNQLKTGQDSGLKSLNTQAFATRLRWLQDKFKNIERSSVAIEKKDDNVLDQSSIDDLMSSLGL